MSESNVRGGSSQAASISDNSLNQRRSDLAFSETSPLLGATPARSNFSGWGNLVKELQSEDSAAGESSISDRIARTEDNANGQGYTRRRSDHPFGDLESGRDTPLASGMTIGVDTPPLKRKSLPAVVKQRTKYYVPVTSWLPNYDWSTFGGDFISGMSVACLIIPQAMSYASGLAKLTPIAGIYSVIIPGLMYSLLGTCRQLSVGPEAALSLLIGQLITDALDADPHHMPAHPEKVAMAIAGIATMQVGLITFFLGIFRMGFLDVVLSRALLRGFITAIGIIIFIEQLIPMLGLAPYLHDTNIRPFEKFLFIVKHVKYANLWTAGLSLVSLTWLIGARILKQGLRSKVPALKFLPEIFLLAVCSIVTTGYFRLDLKGIAVLGKLESNSGSTFGIPFQPKYLKYAHETFPTAAVIAVIGYVDSIVAAKENSLKFSYPISANRELVALGASNFVASFCTGTGCVPAFGSITRSRLNANIGGRSQMSGIITSLFAITTLFFLQYFHYLPKAVLASIVAVVVYSILAEVPHEVSFYWRSRAKTDALQATMTFVLTLLFSVEVGLVASVAFSLILVIQKSTKPRITILGRVRETDQWIPIDENPDAIEEDLPGVLVVRIRENLNFANTGQLKERLRRLELYGHGRTHPSEDPKREEAEAIVFHMNDVEDIDASALQIVYELVKSYKERRVSLYFVHVRSKQLKAFERIGLTELLDESHFPPDLRTAMQQIEHSGSFRAT